MLNNCKTRTLIEFRRIRIPKKFKSEFTNNLKKIGYYFNNKKKTNFLKTVKAFQRHYRKELINGIIDKECLIIAINILKKL